MRFEKTPLAGVVIVRPERVEDDRGFFARTSCVREFAAEGLDAQFVQCSISFNRHKGTLRGMHYQASPYVESKLVRCTMGSLYDVVIDLRPGSATFGKHVGAELTVVNRFMVYVPEGCAHGFLTLEPATEVFYQITREYRAEAARGVRWNDSRFGIAWPAEVVVISERDRSYPDFVADPRCG